MSSVLSRRHSVDLVCFPLVLAVYLAHLFTSGYDVFYYDSAFYWQLGQSFASNGHFSLFDYSGAEYHGYSMPLVCHILQVTASALGIGSVTIVKLFGALLATALGVIVLPRLARELFPSATLGIGRVLALNALIFLFWRDYFNFPLSDFLALLLGTTGLLLLLRGRPTGYLGAGIAVGLAVNMRPAYQPALIATLAVAALLPLRPWNWRLRGTAVGLVLAGLLVAALPAILINHHQFGKWSPSLPGGKVLAMQQLSDGLIAQKYETYVGPASKYPQPEVFYFDPATQHVLQEEHLSTTDKAFGQYTAIKSYGQYLRIVVNHPVELAASYVRHVFNGLDVRYPSPYVRDLGDTSILLSLLQYTLMFVAIARLLLPGARRALGGVRWVGIVVLLSPCITALPSEAESRYFLPVQMLVYMLVCFGPATQLSFLAWEHLPPGRCRGVVRCLRRRLPDALIRDPCAARVLERDRRPGRRTACDPNEIGRRMSAAPTGANPAAALPTRPARASDLGGRFRVEIVCFPFVAAAYAAHLFLSGYDRFYYDSSVYWQLGHSFHHNGHFSLVGFQEGVPTYPRGYSLPLLNHLLQVIASAGGLGSVTIVKIFGALLAATLGVIVAPRLARQLFPRASTDVGRVLALNALFFLFWRDHFDFPLSDFPALLVASVALLGLLRGSPRGYLVAGVGFGLAVNMRPAYQPALLAALLVAALLPIRPWNWRLRGTAAALVLVGAFAAFLPQMMINHHQNATWTPFVSGGKNISFLQLSDGMIAQKYETYVGTAEGYPQPQVFYLDPATTNVLEREHLSTTLIDGQNASITSYGQYIRLVFDHPAEMTASYLRHIFNGLDVRYPSPYVRNLENSSIVLSLLAYTLIFLAIARLLLSDARHALGRVRWAGLIVLVSTCLTAIPGAVEPRFFLPLQLLIYMLVCFGPATRATIFAGSVARRAGVAVAYVAFVLVCVTLSSETLSHLEHPGPTLGAGASVHVAGGLRPEAPRRVAHAAAISRRSDDGPRGSSTGGAVQRHRTAVPRTADRGGHSRRERSLERMVRPRRRAPAVRARVCRLRRRRLLRWRRERHRCTSPRPDCDRRRSRRRSRHGGQRRHVRDNRGALCRAEPALRGR